MQLETGDSVRQGQIVAHIISREVEAAQNGLAVARQIDPEGAPDLIAPVRKYEGGAGIAVRAPENAIVAERLVSSGQIVGDLETLADLIDPRTDYVEAAVPVNYLAAISLRLQALVTTPIHPQTEYPARVAGIGPEFTPNGATSPVRFEFIPPMRITEADAPVEVRVTTRSVADAICVPAAALFQDAGSGSYYVFVAGSEGLAHRTPVSVGISTPARVQITAGVRPGDIVITSGGYALSNGLKVNVVLAQQ
jgi:HlyD family secretion protein